MPITMVAGRKRHALITIRSVDPDLNDRLAYFIDCHLHANMERQRRPRSLVRRLRDALRPDVQYNMREVLVSLRDWRFQTGGRRVRGCLARRRDEARQIAVNIAKAAGAAATTDRLGFWRRRL
jgi:hypothetical protein